MTSSKFFDPPRIFTQPPLLCFFLFNTHPPVAVIINHSLTDNYSTKVFRYWSKFDLIVTHDIYFRIVFGHFFLMNLVLWYEGSSAAIPFLTLVALLALWFGVSVPLTFVGAFFGFRKRPIEHPVRTNQIPRQVPDQSCYTQVINN